MAKNLILFNRGFNEGEKTHFVFSSKSTYLALLTANYQMASLDLPNYKINDGEVLISLKFLADHLETDPYKCVYMAIHDTENAERDLFYKVVRAYEQSGYVRYEVELDVWASFMDNAVFRNIHVVRCNRNIGNGRYDDVEKSEGSDFYEHYQEVDADSNYKIVFSCAIVTHTEWLGNDPITQTFLLACNISDLPALTSEFEGHLDVVDKVRDIMGGVYETTSFGAVASQQHASVLKCWLVPKDLVQVTAVETALKINSPFIEGGSGVIRPHVVRMGTFEKAYSIASFLTGGLNDYPRYKCFWGAKNNFIALTRDTKTDENNLFARLYADTDNIRIEIGQGDNRQEITDAFEVDCSINNQMGTSAQANARNTAKIIGAVGTAVKAYALMSLGTAYALPAGIAVGAQGVAGLMTPSHATPSAPVGNGGAGATLSCQSATKLLNPFGISVMRSAINENAKAYMKGANFNDFIASFAVAEGASHLGTLTGTGLPNRDADTFIACDSVCIDGLNGEAQDFIMKELKRGIWLRTL